jgi:hypothetical protein
MDSLHCIGVSIWHEEYPHAQVMRTRITLPDHLFHEAEEYAKLYELSRSELYQRAIKAYLVRQPEAITEELNRFYAKNPEVLELSDEDRAWMAYSWRVILENSEWDNH